MTLQEIFDKVAVHLLTQQERSETCGGCAYRGERGLMCAVGCLIPDELYDSSMESLCATTILVDFPEFGKYIRGNTPHPDMPYLLSRLQNIHDHDIVDMWHYALQRCAHAYKLDDSVLNKFA